MRPLRLALAAAALAFSVYAIATLLVPRYRCNVVVRSAEKRIGTLFGTQDEVVAMPLLRLNVIELSDCEQCTRDDYRLHMFLGWSHYRADRFAEAEQSFAKGLKYEKRPELLASLAMAELQLGKTELATDHLTEAAMFNSDITDNIPYGEVRQVVLDRIHQRETELGRRP